MKLDPLEAQEYHKYKEIYSTHPKYGDSNHGKAALALFASHTRTLDFGCGNNQFAEALAAKGCYAIGMDFASPKADIKGGIDEILNQPRFDWFTAFDVLEHIHIDRLPYLFNHAATKSFFFCFSISHERSGWNGRTDLHITVAPRPWWLDRLSTYASFTHEYSRARNGHPYIVGAWK